MPEFGVSCAECPANTFQRYTGLNMRIFYDVSGIIERNKIKVKHLPENGQSEHYQYSVNDKFLLFVSYI
jgi:hypothetical protein